MKKYLIIIISAFCLVPLVLCGTLFNSCVSISETEEKREQVRKLKEYLSSVEADTTFAIDNYNAQKAYYTIGETATMERSTIKLLEATEFEPDGLFAEPQEGYVYVAIKVEITNIDDVSHYAHTDKADAYCNDVLLENTFTSTNTAPGDVGSGDIEPGRKVVGWFSFEAPKDWEEIEVVYKDIGFFWTDKVTFKFAK